MASQWFAGVQSFYDKFFGGGSEEEAEPADTSPRNSESSPEGATGFGRCLRCPYLSSRKWFAVTAAVLCRPSNLDTAVAAMTSQPPRADLSGPCSRGKFDWGLRCLTEYLLCRKPVKKGPGTIRRESGEGGPIVRGAMHPPPSFPMTIDDQR